MIREVWGGYYSGLIGISPWHVAVILLPASECDVGSAVISITLHFPSFAGQHQPINTLLFFSWFFFTDPVRKLQQQQLDCVLT